LFGTSIRVVSLLLTVILCSLPGKLHPSNSAYAATGVPESLSRYADGFARDKHGRITGVDLRGEEITVSLLSDLGALQGLRSLNLAGTALTDDALRSLGALGSIEKLDLRGCKINAGSLALLQSLKKLKSLRLSGKNTATHVSDADIARLSNIENLRALFIDFLPIGDTGIHALCSHPNLRELGVAGTMITDASLQFAATIPHLKKLRVANTQITGVGLRALEYHKAIQDLDLSGCHRLREEYLSSVKAMPGIVKLNLYDSSIGDAGVRHLESISKMKWLNLDKTLITDAALVSVAKMSDLEFLHVGSTQISDEGLMALGELKQLKEVVATQTMVTDSGIRDLQKNNPALMIKSGAKAP
jgi:hypothetical protein